MTRPPPYSCAATQNGEKHMVSVQNEHGWIWVTRHVAKHIFYCGPG